MGDGATVDNCDFSSTQANGEGGAVYVNGNDADINGCNFNDINATGQGGGIGLFDGSNSNIANCNFTSVRAFSGSAIAVKADNVTIENITVEHATSQQWGAVSLEKVGIVVDGQAQYPYSNNAYLNNIRISDSTSKELGGGIYLGGDNCVLNNSVITDCSSYMGGGVYFNGHNGTIENTEVSNNRAKSGAGVFWIGNDGTLKNSVVTYNHATESFGGVAYSSKLKTENNEIHDNTPIDSDFEDYSNMPSAVRILEYESYFIDMADGSVGFCINPDRLRGDERDIFLAYKEDNSMRKLRASTTDSNNVLLVYNKVTNVDVSEYVKILYYKYYKEIADNTLKTAYLIFFNDGNFRSSTNSLVKDVVAEYDRGTRIPTNNAQKLITGTDGKPKIRTFQFATLINTQPTGQNLMTITYNDVPVVYNLTVEKITLTPEVPVGEQTMFTIRVTNNGNWNQSDITVSEVSYTGLKYKDFTDSTGKWQFIGTQDNPQWKYPGTLKPGQSAEFTVIFDTIKPGNYTNIVTASNENSSDDANNTTKVLGYGIKVQKITITPIVPVGNQTSFIIRVTNTGELDLVNVNVTEVKFEGLTYHTFSDSTGKWRFDETSDNPMWIYEDTLHVNESAEFTVIFNATVVGNFTNIVTAGNDKTNDTGNNTTEVRPYGIKVEKISLTPDVPIGNQTMFIIRVTNTGYWNLTNVNVTEVKYDGLTYHGFVDSTEKWKFIDSSAKPMWIYEDTLHVNESAEFTVIFNTTAPGNFTNIVTAGNDKTNDTGNNTTEVHSFGMKVVKTSLTPSVEVGEPALFMISVTNTGDWELSNFNITEINTEGLEYYDFIPEDHWIFVGTKDNPIWNYNSTLPIGKTVTLTVIYTTLRAGNFTNVVSVGNNQTSGDGEHSILLLSYNLTVTKTTLTPKVQLGELTSFLIKVNNTGNTVLGKVYVVELKHDGLIYDHYVDPSGKWVFDGKNKWVYNDDLVEGAIASFTVFFKTTQVGNFTNTVGAGSNSTNETTTENITEVYENKTIDNSTTNTTNKTDIPKKHENNKHKGNITKQNNTKPPVGKKHSVPAKAVENSTGNPFIVLIMAVLLLFASVRYRKR